MSHHDNVIVILLRNLEIITLSWHYYVMYFDDVICLHSSFSTFEFRFIKCGYFWAIASKNGVNINAQSEIRLLQFCHVFICLISSFKFLPFPFYLFCNWTSTVSLHIARLCYHFVSSNQFFFNRGFNIHLYIF